MKSVAACPYCGAIHSALCPRISAIEYFRDGTTRRVEFFGSQPVVQFIKSEPAMSIVAGAKS